MTTPAITIPTNPVDLKKILASMKEASDSFTRIEAERDQVAAILDDLNDKFPDIGKGVFKKLITHYHKQNLEETEAKMSDIAALYATIVK